VRGHVFEATDLRLLRLQREEGVEDDVDEGVATLNRDIGEVAEGDLDARSARFSPEPGHHLLRGIDPLHLDAAFCKGKGNAPRPNGELERRAGAGEFGEERDCCFGVERDRLNPLVVDLGEAITVSRRSVLLDVSILWRRPASPNAASRCRTSGGMGVDRKIGVPDTLAIAKNPSPFSPLTPPPFRASA
jgi:hypothetical protein